MGVAVDISDRLDISGLEAPETVRAIRRRLSGLMSGAILEVTADDGAAVRDVPAFCTQAGHALVMVREEGPKVIFAIQARQPSPPPPQ